MCISVHKKNSIIRSVFAYLANKVERCAPLYHTTRFTATVSFNASKNYAASWEGISVTL